MSDHPGFKSESRDMVTKQQCGHRQTSRVLVSVSVARFWAKAVTARGSHNKLLLALFLLVYAIVMLLVAEHLYHGSIINVDPLYSTGVANEALKGHGFRTPTLSLFEVGLYHERGWLDDGPPWPSSNRAPLAAITRIPWMAAFGDSLFWATSGYTIFVFVLVLLLAVEIGRKVFHSGSLGLVAGLLLSTTPLALFLGIQGREAILDLLLILGLFYMTVRTYRCHASGPLIRWMALLGVIYGLALLNRPNIVVVAAVVMLPYLCVSLLVRRTVPRGQVMLAFGALCGMACLVYSPLLIYNLVHFDSPFFSSNMLMQPTNKTLATKYMNPWWKLSYPFLWSDGWRFFVGNLGDFLPRIVFLWRALPGFLLAGGTPGTGFTFWWVLPGLLSACVLLFNGVRPRALAAVLRDDRRSAELLLALVLLVGAFGQFLVQPLFAVEPEYQWFLLGPLALAAALPLIRTLHRLSRTVSPPDFCQQTLLGDKTATRLSLLAIVLLAINGAWFWGLRNGAVPPPDRVTDVLSEFGLLYIRAALRGIILWPGFWGIAVGTLLVPLTLAIFGSRRWIYAAGIGAVILALSLPLAHFGFGGSTSAARQVPQWLTPRALDDWHDAAGLTASDQILVSPMPWAAYRHAGRYGVATPEYPDQVYVLAGTYGMPIGGVYVPSPDPLFFSDTGMAYTYQGYLRMLRYGYTMPGFRVGFNRESGIFLARETDCDLQRYLRTEVIDFDQSDASHLVWGWGAAFDRLGRTVTSIEVKQELSWLYRPGLSYESPGGKISVVGPADAEFTFFVDMANPPSAAQFTFWTPKAQTINIVLNSNLVTYGEPGNLLGSVPISNVNQFFSFMVGLDPTFLRDGMNTIAMTFTDHSQEHLAEFDKVEFFWPTKGGSFEIDFGNTSLARFGGIGFRYNESQEGRTWNWAESRQVQMRVPTDFQKAYALYLVALSSTAGQSVTAKANGITLGNYIFETHGQWTGIVFDLPANAQDPSGWQTLTFNFKSADGNGLYVAFDRMYLLPIIEP